MEANKVNIFLSDEAKAFVRSLPEKAQKKVTFNIRKVESGEMDKDFLNLTPASELVDEVWGKIGTPERDKMEAQVREELNAYFVGEAIKKARQAQHLTQEELGVRIGVQRAQISRLEKGKSVITLPTMSRVFRALGINSGILDLGTIGKVTLW